MNGDTGTPDLNGKLVIIADDDPNCFAIVNYLLKKTGADIIHAEDGARLLELLENTHPDLIMLDISMPEMNGHDCLKIIRSNPGIQARVIMQSAYSYHEQLDHADRSDADGYLMKPVRKEELYTLLGRVLDV